MQGKGVQPFDVIHRYFWVICIALSGINYLFAHRIPPGLTGITDAQRARRTVLLRRGLVFSTFPWLVMGFGIETRNVDGVFSYFDPNAGNAYVWAWYVAIFLLACGFCYWVFVNSGAKEIVELKLLRAHGPRGDVPLRESWIKLLAAMGPLFVVLWIWMASSVDLPK